jgi:hypothetical protein
MKTLVIGLPESLPPELADNPDVIVVDPETLPEEVLQALDAASGGMLMETDGEETVEGGEGPLDDWAKDEEKEHGMGGRAGEEDDEEKGGGADDEEKDPLGGEGDDDKDMTRGGEAGYGPDEDEEERKRAAAAGGSRGGRRGGSGFGVTISGRGAAIPALTSWARAMGRGGR